MGYRLANKCISTLVTKGLIFSSDYVAIIEFCKMDITAERFVDRLIYKGTFENWERRVRERNEKLTVEYTINVM